MGNLGTAARTGVVHVSLRRWRHLPVQLTVCHTCFIVQRICENSLIYWQKHQISHTYSPSSTNQNKMKTHLKFLLVAMVTRNFGGKKPKICDFCNIAF